MHLFLCRTFALSKVEKLPAVLFALPRKSAAPQQSQKASFRFVFGLHDL